MEDPPSSIFLADGRQVIAYARYGGAYRVDLDRGRMQRLSPVEFQCGLDVSPNGKLAVSCIHSQTSGAEDTYVYDLERSRLLRKIPGYTKTTWVVAFAPDSRRFLTWTHSLGSMHGSLWDAETGEELKQFEKWCPDCSFAAFSPDGEVLLLSEHDGPASFIEVESEKDLFSFVGFDTTPRGVFLPDGRHAVLYGDAKGRGRMILVDFRRGRIVREFLPPRQARVWSTFSGAALSPDGRTLAAAFLWSDEDEWRKCPGEILLWHLPDRLGLWLLGTQE